MIRQALILILLVFSVNGFGKSRPVFLDKELDSAKIIQFAKILKYDKTTLTLKLTKSGKTVDCKIYCSISEIKDYKSSGLTGILPGIGDTILVVIDKNDRLALVAKQIDNKSLRFWSPMETGSIALFYFKAPVSPIPNEKGLGHNEKGFFTCWDGCLFPIDKLIIK
jgi:hypothetical protein